MTLQPTTEGIGAAVRAEADSFFSQTAKLEHAEVLQEIFDNLQKIDFEHLAGIEQGKQANQTHLRVLTIREILRVAKELNCGLCRNQDFIYVYDGTHWQIVPREKLETFLGLAAAKLGVNSITAEDCEFRAKLFKQFMATAYLPKPERSGEKVLINLQNGTFEISKTEMRLRGFDRNDFLTYQLPFSYDADVTCPKWQNFLDEMLPEKNEKSEIVDEGKARQKVLAEYFGYVFTDLKLERTLFCYGGGNNGKSVTFDVMYAVLGKENVSNYSLEALGENYFRAMLANKLLNYSSEISSRLESHRFKQLTSGEPVEARLPYGQPMILTHYAKLAFNCNELPKDVEHTDGFFRRFLIIPFDVKVPKEKKNPNLAKDIIQSELSGVFNWILDGLKRLLQQGDFSDCDLAEKTAERFRRETDSVAMFLADEKYQASATTRRKVAEIYGEYKTYCADNLYRALGRNNFCKRLELNGIPREDSYQPFFLIEKAE